MSAEHSGEQSAGVLPAGVTLDDAAWDDPDGVRLRTQQQAEIHVRYGIAPASSGVAGHINPAGVFATVVLRVDGEAVGFAALRDLSETDDPAGFTHGPGVCELKRLYVAPHARGRGFSRLIVRTLESRAAAHSMTRLVLETGTQQPESLGLYLAMGYQPIEQYGEYHGESDSRCFAKDLPQEVTVERVAWSHLAAVDLRREFFDTELAPLYPHVAARTESMGGYEASDDALGRRAAVTVIARRGGVVVGCAHALVNGEAYEVAKVYVTAAGRRCGVARTLMTELEAAARENRVTRLLLITGIRQHAAIALYRSLGYRPVYPFGANTQDATALWFALAL